MNDAVLENLPFLVYEELQNKILGLPKLDERHINRYMALLQQHLEKNDDICLEAWFDFTLGHELIRMLTNNNALLSQMRRLL